MPLDKPRNPSNYPAVYGRALQQGVGCHLIVGSPARKFVEIEMKRFRTFRKSLRLHLHHPLSKWEVLYILRTEIRRNEQGDEWELWVHIRPRKVVAIPRPAADADLMAILRSAVGKD